MADNELQALQAGIAGNECDVQLGPADVGGLRPGLEPLRSPGTPNTAIPLATNPVKPINWVLPGLLRFSLFLAPLPGAGSGDQ